MEVLLISFTHSNVSCSPSFAQESFGGAATLSQVYSLIEDIRSIRRNKIKAGLTNIKEATPAVKVCLKKRKHVTSSLVLCCKLSSAATIVFLFLEYGTVKQSIRHGD